MISPKKLGVRLDPPALVYIYEKDGIVRLRVMPVRNIWPTSETDFVVENLRHRHSQFLKPVPDEKIRKMIEIIKLHKKGNSNIQQIVKQVEAVKVSEKEKTKTNTTVATKDLSDAKNTSLPNNKSSNLEKMTKIDKLKSLMDEFEDFDFDSEVEDPVLAQVKKNVLMKEEKKKNQTPNRLENRSSLVEKRPAKLLPPAFMTQKNDKYTNYSQNMNQVKMSENENRKPFENLPSEDDNYESEKNEDTDLDFSDGDNPLDISDIEDN